MRQGRIDGPDAKLGAIDILKIRTPGYRRLEWRLELRSAPPLASTLDPARRIIEHGLIIDADGDRVADCHIGINTDAPTPGDLRVWVKNLRTGGTDERVGGSYGIHIDFVHPGEGEHLPGSQARNHDVLLPRRTRTL